MTKQELIARRMYCLENGTCFVSLLNLADYFSPNRTQEGSVFSWVYHDEIMASVPVLKRFIKM